MPRNNKSGFKRGQKAPASGQYQEIGPRGGPGREVTVPIGQPLPNHAKEQQKRIQASADRRPQPPGSTKKSGREAGLGSEGRRATAQ